MNFSENSTPQYVGMNKRQKPFDFCLCFHCIISFYLPIPQINLGVALTGPWNVLMPL